MWNASGHHVGVLIRARMVTDVDSEVGAPPYSRT